MLMELRHPVEPDAGDHLVHEALARRVDDPHAGVVVHQRAADGVHQVGLAHPDAAVDEQRVVAARRSGRDRLRGGVRELVAGADHESCRT